MKLPIVIQAKHFPPKPFAGISLFGLSIFRKEYTIHPDMLQHEAIHFRQQIEWLFLPFFIVYVAEFLFLLVRYRKWHTAYRNISFEREAYGHEHEKDYLKHRKVWANYRQG